MKFLGPLGIFVLAFCLALPLDACAQKEADHDPLQIGPFKLGAPVAQFVNAAKVNNFSKARRQAPEERNVMGLGGLFVAPYSMESRDEKPSANKLWGAVGYMLNKRLVYVSLDYALEDPERAKRWFEIFHAPRHIRKKHQDTTWHYKGVVFHVDRFGRSLYAVNWAGLRNSDRILVGSRGAVAVANRYFRIIRAQKAQQSVDLIRRRIIEYYSKGKSQSGEEVTCASLPSVDHTPTASACDLPSKRFNRQHANWNNKTWAALGIQGKHMSPYYSYSIDASGTHGSTRIVLQARGDLDCNDNVATIRVTLRADMRSDRYECNLNDGRWELINPTE